MPTYATQFYPTLGNRAFYFCVEFDHAVAANLQAVFVQLPLDSCVSFALCFHNMSFNPMTY